ncbi:pyruvate ferredoxin oxidoreductase [Candidatus Bathyarchaeota archaeon]|nr:MAG: pyruvate ferredoxin oxidoreductase [Candidatus Bathyarchaeota archaeon]
MGGQGIILAGTVLGIAACVYGGLQATQVASYGPEARGGRVFTEVVISDEEIDYPRVVEPDVVVVMSQRAYNEFAGHVKPGGTIIYDPDLVEPHDPPGGVELVPIPATREAERLGMRLSANMIMLGALTALCGFLEPAAVEEAIRYRVRRALDVNLRAFRLGYELGLRHLGRR